MNNFTPRYISVDIETTGLDPDRHQILEFAAVAWISHSPIEEQPYFQRIIDPGGDIVGEPRALVMNERVLWELRHNKGVHIDKCFFDFDQWLRKNLGVKQKIHLVGQNVGSFDLQFLRKVNTWPSDLIHHRCFDVSTIFATGAGMESAYNHERPLIEGNLHEALYDARIALYHAINFLNRVDKQCCPI